VRPVDAATWIAAFAKELGVEAPTDEVIEELLSLAGTAAHASERKAAPIACFLVAMSGQTAADAHEIARGIPTDS
jgi:hypothetical protein